MSDLDDLYRDIILDHYRSPRGAADLSHLAAMVHENPACGDSIKLDAAVEDGRVRRVRFDAKGCAISTASASIMTTVIEGRPLDDALELARSFIRAVRGEGSPDILERTPELAAFGGLARFPVRVKCATLPWHALLLTLARSPLQELPSGQPTAARRPAKPSS